MKKIFKNTFGFGLVEVLMAAGLAGGIALTIAKLSQDANRVTKTTESNNEINMFMTDAAYILSDKENCMKTIVPGTAVNGAPITAIKKYAPTTPPDDSVSIYSVGPKYGNGLFSITGMQTDNTDGNPSLKITVVRNNVTTTGARSIVKKIPLKVVLTGGNIASCFSDTEDMIEDAAKAACTGNSAKWDDLNKVCIHDILITGANGSGICPDGQALKAMVAGTAPANGEPANFTCQAVTTTACPAGEYQIGFNTAGAVTCAPLPCAPGQLIRKSAGGVQCVDIPSCPDGSTLLGDAILGFKCINATCGPNEYLSAINSNGGSYCKEMPTGAPCGTGQYVKQINADGSLVCEAVPASASGVVGVNQYLRGYDASSAPVAGNYPTCAANGYLTFNGTTFSCLNLPPQSAWSPDSNGVSGTSTFRNQINGNNSSYVSLEISNSAMGNSEARLQLDGGGGYDFKIGSIAWNATASSFSSYGEPGGGYIGGANTKSIGINTHFVPYVMYTSRIPTLGLAGRRWAAIYLSSSPNVSSDARLKNSVSDSRLGLDFVNQLRPVEYKLNKSESTINKNELKFGFIAQEVEKALETSGVKKGSSEIVTKDEKGFFGMTYTALISPIIKAIQELNGKIEELFSSQASQEKVLLRLEQRIEKLEKENKELRQELKKKKV